MLTEKQQQYKQKRCTYCNGTGHDTFDKEKVCPNCSKEPVLMKKKFMSQKLFNI